MSTNKKNKYIYTALHKHIMVMIYLSLGPGLAYVFLGWYNDIVLPAVIWYLALLLLSTWGLRLHKEFNYSVLGDTELALWHIRVSIFFYLIFSLWAVIFILYANETESKMHYIAIFTELGALVVASTLMFANKQTLKPILVTLTLPLSIYFFMIGELYGYILTIFSFIFSWVLFYSSRSSDKLLQRANYQASHDQLTKLLNRHGFIDLLQRAINELNSTRRYSYMLLIDLDHFKSVNDSFGHNIGDKLLKQVSLRLQEASHKEGSTSRIGGDEFVYLGRTFSTPNESLADAKYTAETILAALKKIYLINSNQIYISASIGISLLDQHSADINDFIKEADTAMYEVKHKGRDGAIIFNDELSKKLQEHLAIEYRLRFALEHKEMFLNFQPQFDSHKNIIGCETLVRWNNKELGMVPTDKFINIAEQTGYIVELGNYILEESLKTLMDWYLKGIRLQQFSINISTRQLFDHTFIENTIRLCKLHLDAHLRSILIFEITETHLIEDLSRVVTIIETLKEHINVKFSIDDFGTGYSSLSYLQKLPVDEIKIDKSFVDNLDLNTNNQNMVEIMLNMAEVFNLSIVAEGVETQEQYDYLIRHKCSYVQGYFFSKPLDKEDFEKFYLKHNKTFSE